MRIHWVADKNGGKAVPFTEEEEAARNAEEQAWADEQAELVKTKYQRDRKAEYDRLNQFEMQFDDQRDGTTTWVDAINAIKKKFPKPE